MWYNIIDQVAKRDATKPAIKQGQLSLRLTV